MRFFPSLAFPIFGQGSTLGVNVFAAGTVQNNGPFYIGYEINVSTPITVAGLGILDFSSTNQLSAAVNVGIYSCSPGGTSPKVGTYITSLQLQSGLGLAQGPVDYFVQGLPTPVVLTPGNYLILAEAGSGKPQGYSTGATVFFTNNVTYVNGWFGGSAFPGAGTNVTVTNQSNGNGSYMSPVYLVQLNPTATTTLTSSSNPSSIGQSVTFNVSVSPNSATGTVSFYDNSGQIGTAQTLTGGTASVSKSYTSATTQQVYAVYSGDSNNTGSQSNRISQVVSSAPQISPITISGSLPSGQVGQPYNASFSASGGAGSYSWSAAGLPPGLSMSGSGVVIGTPTAPGSYFVNVSVSGSGGGSASESFTVVITAAPVTISGNTNLGDIPIGGSVAGSFGATGGTPPYRWSISGISGLSVDSNGNVRGSVTQAGNLTASLSVTDSASGSATLSLNLSVLGISGTLPAGSTTAPYSASVTAVGGVGPYAYAASGVPQGLAFSAGTLSGTPASAGSYSIGVRVTDSKGISASGTFALSITGPAPTSLTVTSTSLPDAYVGQSYSQTLNAGGGSAPYTWSLSGGKLPAGLSLTTSGSIVGTPSSPLSTSFGVKVTDSSNNQAVGNHFAERRPGPASDHYRLYFPERHRRSQLPLADSHGDRRRCPLYLQHSGISACGPGSFEWIDRRHAHRGRKLQLHSRCRRLRVARIHGQSRNHGRHRGGVYQHRDFRIERHLQRHPGHHQRPRGRKLHRKFQRHHPVPHLQHVFVGKLAHHRRIFGHAGHHRDSGE